MDFYNSRFYADLKRAMRLHIFNVVITTILAAIMFFVLLFFIYAFFGFLNMQWLYWIIFAVFIALFVCKEMRPAFKKRNKIVSQFCGMNSGTLAAMDDRYDTMTAEFGTLFLFDEYIYFPDAMLLIPYSDIAKATAEFPRVKVMHFFRIGVGAVLKIRCMNGKKYSINIKHRKEFRDYHKSFLAALGETTAIAIKDIDYKELADKNIIAKITANCNRSEAVKKLCSKAFWLDAAKAAAADLVIMLAYWRLTSSFSFALGETRYKAF
ncbi:MAG: hypothetical protein K2K44_09220, partial [Oscillospiraceae bacterium]|nr:hypothetical protein [Oscillospiraceae bacterium]